MTETTAEVLLVSAQTEKTANVETGPLARNDPWAASVPAGVGWAQLAQSSFSLLLLRALSVLFYLAISALDGILATRQNQDPTEAFAPGFIVGGVAFLLAMPTITLLPPPFIPCTPGRCNGFFAEAGGALLLIILGVFFFLEAMFVGPLGGWIGGRLWRRYAASDQRSKPAEDDVY